MADESNRSTQLFQPPCGPIIAYQQDGVLRARGVPYASAKRFCQPEPTPDWQEPFHANQLGRACPQFADEYGDELMGISAIEGLQQDENCLTLVITLPLQNAEPKTEDTLLPVLFFIHGGSYVTGAGESPLCDPARLVAEHNLIAVNVTYRLGLFGLLGDGVNRQANLALLDMMRALHWIQRNIHAFGGDPRRVTIAGQSAGADAVAHLLATHEAPQLFSRAIIQSAPWRCRQGREKMQRELLEKSKDVTSDMPTQHVVERTKQLLQVAKKFGDPSNLAMSTQAGYFPLPAEEDMEAAWRANAPHIALLVGNTKDEVTIFIAAMGYLHLLYRFPILGRLTAFAIARFFTHLFYGAGSQYAARLWSSAGGQAYLYSIGWCVRRNRLRSTHAIELPLLFPKRGVYTDAQMLKGATPHQVAAAGLQLRQVWANFIHAKSWPESATISGLISYKRV